jgi:hypothetical protein
MIISEKQILWLMQWTDTYRNTLLINKSQGQLTETGHEALKQISELMTMIYNQQSGQLKVIE